MDDADAATNTMDMPFRFYPCFVAGLAYYISLKKNPQLNVLTNLVSLSLPDVVCNALSNFIFSWYSYILSGV